MSCQPYNVSDLCPDVCPIAEALHENVVSIANSCLKALEEFPGTVLVSLKGRIRVDLACQRQTRNTPIGSRTP